MSPLPKTVRLILNKALAQAATLGAFDPVRVLDPKRPQHLAALEELARNCAEVLGEGKPMWLLRPDARSHILSKLANDELSEALQSISPAPGDRFGEILHKVLQKGEVDSSKFDMPDLGLLRTALQFASSLRDTKHSVREVDRRLAQRDAEQATKQLIPHRLVGRTTQLAKLHGFVFEDAGLAAEDIMWITGAGGCGKSALLAKFADSLRNAKIPVMQIDFDRPAMYCGSLTTLMMEVSRQLALSFPAMEEDLSKYRRAIRAATPTQGDSYGYEGAQMDERRRTSVWKACMGQWLPINSEIVFIIDTAEELGFSSQLDIDALRRWLRHLRVKDGLPKLKVVVSGRAFEADDIALVSSDRRIDLHDLSLSGAQQLLRICLKMKNLEVNAFPLDELVDMLGGNPLMLKILAEFLAEGGPQAGEALLADRSGFDKRFAQSFLYKRILNRIRTEEKDVVKLAHPGLILRRVTPHLIQYVLAKPCDLENITEARAHEVFKLLANQVWLVQQTTNPEVVIHRRDLRRLMLHAMTAKDEAIARQIHTFASVYYLEGRDPLLTREEQNMEGLYHQLFISNDPLPDHEILDALARRLGEDLETLPLTVRARMKLVLRRKLTNSELKILTNNDQALYESSRERKNLLETGLTTRLTPAARLNPVVEEDARVSISHIHEAFETGKINVVVSGISVAVEEFQRTIIQRNRAEFSEDFTRSAVWRCAIANFKRGIHSFIPDSTLKGLDEKLMSAPLIGSSSRAISAAEAYQMLFRIHGANFPESITQESFSRPSSKIATTQEFRSFQLRDKKAGDFAEVSVRLLRDLAPQYRKLFEIPAMDGAVLDSEGHADLEDMIEYESSGACVTLDDIERFGKRDGNVLIFEADQIDRNAKDILIGRVPEVYPLVRAAVRACKASTLVSFASNVSKTYSLWPIELSQSRLEIELASQREQCTAILIVLVDRFGLLRRFIDWMEDRNRLSKRDRQLMQLVRDYELRLRHFI